jgi:hypothetical protein
MPRPNYLSDNLHTPMNRMLLDEHQRDELRTYVQFLLSEGRHLEASTLYSTFFPWA